MQIAKRDKREGHTLADVHWEVIQGSQEYLAGRMDQDHINIRNLHNAFEEHLHGTHGSWYQFRFRLVSKLRME
jgi:hypothetical protein